MGAITQYAIKVAFILASFYLVYKWALASASFHRFNRVALLAGLGMALGAIPIWDCLQYEPTGPFAAQMAELDREDIPFSGISSPVLPKAVIIVYLSGVFVSICVTAYQAAKIGRIISHGTKSRSGSHIIVYSKAKAISPFSWGKWIVVPSTIAESDRPTVIEHEKYHLNHLHWIDLAIYQCVIIFNWFNPAAYLLMKEIQDAHEFEVDADVIATGRINAKDYQMLLLRNAIGGAIPHFTDKLNHNRLKTRLKMMQRIQTNPMRRLLAISIVPVMLGAVSAMDYPALAAHLATIKGTTLTRVSMNEVHYAIMPQPDGGEKHSISYSNQNGLCKVGMDVTQGAPPPKIYLDNRICSIDNLSDINSETIEILMVDTNRNCFVIKTM